MDQKTSPTTTKMPGVMSGKTEKQTAPSGTRSQLSRFKTLTKLFFRQLGRWWRYLHLPIIPTPKGLYARALIIIIAPVVLLQSVLVFVFMERHWDTVTRRLSSAVTGDMAAIVAMLETYNTEEERERITEMAREKMRLRVSVLEPTPLPPPADKPFFSLLDRVLSNEIRQKIGKPFWIDTVGRSNLVEVRVQLEDSVVQFVARRSQTYASNSHIFMFWMVGTSLVLLIIAVLFLRNQIRPILRLADAAEAFGKGQDVENFHPAGAREVRRASRAFILMKERIERQIDQRTAMLSGVSHDLRTVLTRFRLQLALLSSSQDTSEMEADVEEMQRMLEEYLAFAKGESGEDTAAISLSTLVSELATHAELAKVAVSTKIEGEDTIKARPNALKRCLMNLVSNACRVATEIEISVENRENEQNVAKFHIDDNGPGIPEEEYGSVFKPFYRLDEARTVSEEQGGTGLGLSIALDIARSHGGNIELSQSPLGGLRASVLIPS